MAGAVKRTISLPSDLAAEAEALAKAEGKTLSAVVQDALREARARRLNAEFRSVQGFWCAMAKAKGVLSERDLERLLRA
jgi:metal-responsive CopG/Arc/MetJ family transcriptional regulator